MHVFGCGIVAVTAPEALHRDLCWQGLTAAARPHSGRGAPRTLAHQQYGCPPARCCIAMGIWVDGTARSTVSGSASLPESAVSLIGSDADLLSRLAACRLQCRCSAATPIPISAALWRILHPCRSNRSASSRRGCRQTEQGRLMLGLLQIA